MVLFEVLEAFVGVEEVAGVVAVLFDHLLREVPEGVFFFEDEVHDGEVGFGLEVVGL